MRALGEEWKHVGPDTPVIPRTAWEQNKTAIINAMRLMAWELRIPRPDSAKSKAGVFDHTWFYKTLVPRLEKEGLTGDLPFVWIAGCSYDGECFRQVWHRELSAARRQRKELASGERTVAWVLGVATVVGVAALLWRTR